MLSLRPYQERALESIRASMRSGKRRILLQLPTGGGKTLTACAMLAGVLAKGGGRALFVMHRKELIDQTVRTFARLGITSIGVVRAQDKRRDPSQPIQICSIQTLQRRDSIEGVSVVFVDEAHRSNAKSYVDKLFKAYPKAYFVGLSATPCRTDGKPLGELFEELICAATYSQLLKNPDWLVEPMVYSTPVLPDLSSVRTVAGDYNAEDLEAAVNRRALIGNLLSEWQKRAEGRRTVAFAVSVAHSQAIVSLFSEAGVRAEHLDGTTPEDQREAILARLESGETQMVSNVGVLCEGWDMPACKCLLLARPTKSLVLFMQMAGRILRPCDGVTPVILDHGGNIDRHGMPHEDREWSLSAKPKRVGSVPMKCCGQCFAMVASAYMVCPHCGYAFPEPTPEERMQKELEELGHVELALRTLSGDDAKLTEFRRLVQTARSKGYDIRWVRHRYVARFREQPLDRWWKAVTAAGRLDKEWARKRVERQDLPPQWAEAAE